MPAARTPPRRKPLYQHMNNVVGRVAEVGRGAGVLLGARLGAEKRPARAGYSSLKPMEDIEEAQERLIESWQNQNHNLINYSFNSIIRWKDPEKTRRFFLRFFDPERPEFRQLGVIFYTEYRKRGGQALGGEFARLDANFERLHQ